MSNQPANPRSEQAAIRAMLYLVAAFVAVTGAFMLIGAYFAYDTLLKAERRAIESRLVLAAGRIAAGAERAAALGIPPPEQVVLAEVLQREIVLDPVIQSFDVTHKQGLILFSSAAARQGQVAVKDGSLLVTQPIRDDLGQALGRVEVRFDSAVLHPSAKRLSTAILHAIWPSLILACLITLLGGLGLVYQKARAGNPHPGIAQRLNRYRFKFRSALSILTSFALCVSLALFGWQAQHIGEQEITPALVEKAKSVARASATLIELSISTGIPLQQLTGVSAHFDGVQALSPEIAGFELVNMDGTTLYQSKQDHAHARNPLVSEPIRNDSQQVATLKVTVNEEIIGKQLRATMIDIGFFAVVSLLIALELMALILGSSALRPLAELEERIAAAQREKNGEALATPLNPAVSVVRPALFLFMLAEALTRPFMPSHSRSLVTDASSYADLIGSLPLVAFLGVVALCQVPFSSFSDRYGRREGFVLGAFVAALGYALCAWTGDLTLFILARMLSGAGFALVFVSAQGQMIDASNATDRSRSLAVFISAILVAGVCGPPLGGILSDQWGVAVSFQVCAIVCLLAMFSARASLSARQTRGVSKEMSRGISPWASGLRDIPDAWNIKGVRSLLLGCALPAKLIVGAVIFYIVPLALQKMGHSSAEIGRLQIIYPLMMVAGVPVFSALAERLQQRQLFLVAGGILAGACTALVLVDMGTLWIATMLLLLGLGQALSITPQSAIMADLGANLNGTQSSSVMGLLRLVERSGSAIGPAVGALLVGAIGFAPAIAAIGLMVVAGNATHAFVSMRPMNRS